MAKLTVKELESLRPEDKGRRLSDGDSLRGLVRCSKDGHVSVFFTWKYRNSEGKTTEIACGTWPAKRLPEIRSARDEARRLHNQGIDPARQREAERLENRAMQEERIAAAEARLLRPTLRDLFDRWEALELVGRSDNGKEVRRGFEKDVFPRLGSLAAEDITKKHVMEVLDGIVARGANRLANRVLSELRQMFGFGYLRDIVRDDPTRRIQKKHVGGVEEEGTRTLVEAEIRELADKLPTCGLPRRTELAVWIMLSTLARVNEITCAKATNVDLQAGTWYIPKTKNTRPHTVYLSEFASKQFAELLSLPRPSDWLFPGRKPGTHMGTKNITKQVHDHQTIDTQRVTKKRSKKRAFDSVLILSGGTWTPHDLRRTGATNMGELGAREEVIERCLNHVQKKKVIRTYQRQVLKPEQRDAWLSLGEWLSKCLEGNTVAEKNKVVPLVNNEGCEFVPIPVRMRA